VDVIKSIFEWFKSLFTDFNGWMTSVFKFDERILSFYDKAISPLPEWVKIIGLFFVLIALVLGAIQLIKKSFKIVLVLVIVFGIIVLITWL